MTAAKIFMSGRSQAIRLPKQFRVRGSEVFLKKVPHGFIVMERDPWMLFVEGCRELSDDFMANRVRPALKKTSTKMALRALGIAM
jgi:antitoxin VapB